MASWDENRPEENPPVEDEHLEEENYYSMLNVSTDVR